MNSLLCLARSVEAGRRVLNSELITCMAFCGRGEERVEMACWKRKICSCVVGLEDERVWEAIRARRARMYFSARSLIDIC